MSGARATSRASHSHTTHAPQTSRSTRHVRFEIAPRTLVIIGCSVAAIWLATKMVAIILVVIGSFMLVGSLNPLVELLTRKGMSRNRSIALVFAVGTAITVVLGFLTVPPLVSQARSLVEHEAEIRNHAADWLQSFPFTRSLGENLRDIRYDQLFKESRAWLFDASIRAIEVVAYGVAAIFLAIYAMIDRERLRGALFALVPRKHHVRTSRILLNLQTIVGGYIRGQVITCVVIAVFMYVLLTICRVPNALAFAVFGGVIDVLPYVGPFLTIAPAVAAAYTVGPWVALIVLTALLLYEEFESRILMPVVYGRSLRLPSSVVFFSLLVGGSLGGIVGALLALPIAATILMLIEELRVELPGEAPARGAAAQRRQDAREEREYEQRAEDAPAAEAAAIAEEIARESKGTKTEAKSAKPSTAQAGR